MIVSFWNVRGINNPLKQAKVLKRLDSCEVDVICLMESRIRRDNSAKFSTVFSADWNLVENYDCVDGGRLWIIWKRQLSFSVLRRCDQAISIIGTIDGFQTVITDVYDSNSGGTRRGLWEHLKTVENAIGSSSWVIGGDFNIIARAEESSDFDVMGVHSSTDMNEFQDCLEELDLMDHPFLGPIFIWSNRHEGSAMQVLFSKMRRLKPLLKELNKEFYSNISGRVEGKRSELEQIQLFNLTHVEQRRVDEEKRVYDELINLEVAESEFYRQRTKMHWLNEGDLNTKFFHQRVESNKKRNTIRVIKGEDGQFYDTFEGMAAELVKEALFKQGKDKSPGPDGYTSGFFKAAWDILGADFTSAVSQSAFVKGRNIVDNTLLAQEIVKGYSRKSLSPRCAIKVDLQKAFDSVSWDFLLKVLAAMGLPCTFCNWIKACITTPMFSLSLNGSLVGFFKGGRGIRQGNPLSPYLFVLAMNVLSSLLDAAAKHGIFKFHPKCRRISLTHLCFTDDLLVFCHGSLGAVLGVQCTLDKFYELSGLKLNAQKTELYACGVNMFDLEQIRMAIGFRVGQLPVRYLGVPLVTRKLIGKDCEALLTKIKDKLRIWSNKNLSYGGRLQLIKSKGSDSSAKGARVGWSHICSLKSEGGLGLRSLVMWNKACCLLLIKNILANEGSLWIAWINEYCFKLVSFWDVECKAHFSWILSKLLSMREEARRLFLPCPNWSLINDKWIWDNIRDCKAKVNWHRLIWFPAHIPKFSLVSWMVILDRLPTKDRLVRFGLDIDNVCGLCGSGIESRDHLFAECPFAKEVWGIVLIAYDIRYDLNSWGDIFNWLIVKLKGKSIKVRIMKLAWTGLLYFVWEERNHRLFRGLTRSVDIVVNSIKEVVRAKLCRFGCPRIEDVNSHLYLNWGLY
ncbi:uncharacterized protein LOC120124224 [Hibiscus syriacus]|uniref:uncharacterized protein LOC120124224 n=1 Tax=Hibiscus syriacus TaxID=106335 RepID=UPI0019242C3C|nr:uncharacterized protein LOC120124224 [Hibiscus syriacus]